MTVRRTAALALFGFLAAQVGACACRIGAFERRPAAPAAASVPHSCCHKDAPARKKPAAPKPCCCTDGTHEAIADAPAIADFVAGEPVPTPAPTLPEPPSAPRVPFDGSPPSRAPAVPLFTLHASLLI